MITTKKFLDKIHSKMKLIINRIKEYLEIIHLKKKTYN